MMFAINSLKKKNEDVDFEHAFVLYRDAQPAGPTLGC